MSEQNPMEPNDIQPEQEAQPQSSEFSTGQKLANARKALGLSIEELSEQTRVPSKVLVNIESDELPTDLPETFVRGYIRAYAKRVGVPEEQVLQQIETTAPSTADSMKMQSFSKRSKRKKVERRLTIISWAIVAILAIALVAWWAQTKGSEMFAGSDSDQTSDVASTSAASINNDATNTRIQGADAIQVEAANETVEPTSSADNDTHSEALKAAGGATEQTPKDEAASEAVETLSASIDDARNVEQKRTLTQSNETAQSTQTAPLANIRQSQLETVESNLDNAVKESDAELSQQPIVLDDAQKRLLADNGEVDPDDFIKVEFKFANNCWVEVYDAFDERIAIGNKPAGYLMSLNAQGPFKVLLGNPVGVDIWVNGQPYDMSDLPKNRVARFEVDATL